MDNVQLRIDALNNLKKSDLKSFSLENEDLTKLTGWTFIGIFLLEAKTSLDLSGKFNVKESFTEIGDVVLAHGMFKNFILSYAKCFSSGGNRKVKLDPNEIFALRKDLKDIHYKIIAIRNTYVAHNDDNDYNISISLTKEDDKEIIFAQTYTIITPISDYPIFKEIVEYCEQQVIQQFNRKVDKIQNKIGKLIIFR